MSCKENVFNGSRENASDAAIKNVDNTINEIGVGKTPIDEGDINKAIIEYKKAKEKAIVSDNTTKETIHDIISDFKDMKPNNSKENKTNSKENKNFNFNFEEFMIPKDILKIGGVALAGGLIFAFPQIASLLIAIVILGILVIAATKLLRYSSASEKNNKTSRKTNKTPMKTNKTSIKTNKPLTNGVVSKGIENEKKVSKDTNKKRNNITNEYFEKKYCVIEDNTNKSSVMSIEPKKKVKKLGNTMKEAAISKEPSKKKIIKRTIKRNEEKIEQKIEIKIKDGIETETIISEVVKNR